MWQKIEAVIEHTVYSFLEIEGREGVKKSKTMWEWCLCLYMTFTSLHLISHSVSVSSFASRLRLPDIILCQSQRENLIALINKVSWDRQQLQGTMLHKDSERQTGTRHSVKSGWHLLFHCLHLPFYPPQGVPQPGFKLEIGGIQASNMDNVLKTLRYPYIKTEMIAVVKWLNDPML